MGIVLAMGKSVQTGSAQSGGLVGRRDPHATTQRLLKAAAAEFVEHGYDKAVVSRIARRAGVTVGAVYARWANKSEVMVASLDQILDQLLPLNRIEAFGLSQLSTPEIMTLWGRYLLESDSVQDVLIQVFSAARSDAAVQARLHRFLNEQADQLSSLVERGKREGFYKPELSTVALTLLCQSIGIGAHVVLRAGLDDRHIPSHEEWTAVLEEVIRFWYPQNQTDSTE